MSDFKTLALEYSNWDNKRKIVANTQQLISDAGIEVGKVDGYWGPQTDYAFEIWQKRMLGKDESIFANDEFKLPDDDSEEAMISVYGKQGTRQIDCTLPYPLKTAWNQSEIVTSIKCHERVCASLQRVFKRISENYSWYQIQRFGFDLYGGCLSVRKKRGGTSWSTHAWGCAIDLDPDRNQLKWGKDKAFFAHPESKKFIDIWYEEGWKNLGVEQNYDWMHFQKATV